MNEIMAETADLVQNGYKEIVLTGIHLGSFGAESPRGPHRLVELIHELQKIQQLKRLRLSSLDPDDITEELIELTASSDIVMPHFHISLQSGSTPVLEKMNRRYTAEKFVEIAEKIKERIKNVSLTADVIVGFPGETEKDFMESVKVIEKVGFSKVHLFHFSPRPPAPASKMKEQISHREVTRRYNLAREAAMRAALEHRRKFVRTMMEILVEGKEQSIQGRYFGFTPNYLKTIITDTKVPQHSLVNTLTELKIA